MRHDILPLSAKTGPGAESFPQEANRRVSFDPEACKEFENTIKAVRNMSKTTERKGTEMNRTSLQIRKMAFSAMFLAIALVLPFLTGQIPEIGSKLCPMHIPVLLCGFVCGWPWGLAVGFICPLFRSLLFGMPPIFPTAFAMAFELAVYGAIAGLLYRRLPKKIGYIYVSLIVAMIAGRIVWGGVMFLLAGLGYTQFSFAAFLAGAVTNAIPGIILQIVLIPVLVKVFEKAKLVLDR